MKAIAAEVKSCSSARNKESIEILDQYGRRNNLVLLKLLYPDGTYGLDFIEWIVDELNKMFPDLKIPVHISHIDDAHPLRPKKKGKRMSLSSLLTAGCWMKNEVYKRRAQLKDTPYKNISIVEQLTSYTQFLLNTTRTVVGKDTKVYTNNCVISLKYNNRKYFVKNYKDVQFVAKKVGYRFALPPPGYQDQVSSTEVNATTCNTFSNGAHSQQYRDPGPGSIPSASAPYYDSSLFNPYNQGSVGRGVNSAWNYS